MTKLNLTNVEVVKSTVWDVEAHHVNISMNEGIMNYYIAPTGQHEFMMKSGFSRYQYSTWIKRVHVAGDNTVTLYGYSFEKLRITLKMTDDQITAWRDATSNHIKWTKEEDTVNIVSNKQELCQMLKEIVNADNTLTVQELTKFTKNVEDATVTTLNKVARRITAKKHDVTSPLWHVFKKYHINLNIITDNKILGLIAK